MTEPAHIFFLPGFSLTAQMWAPVIEAVGDRWPATALEIPPGLSFDATAASLAAGRSGIWVGYSMGGRIALRIALDHPAATQGLVLVSATAGLADPAARRQRKRRDEALARDIEARGLDWFLDYWKSLPLFQTADRGRADRISDVDRIVDQLLQLGQGVQQPDWSRLADLEMPILLIAGGLDAAYVETARAMAEAIGDNAAVCIVPGAGHAVVHEMPGTVADRIMALG